MREEKGITLVSLVVTIIILVILAGVSINLTLGENGIITKAKQAKENTELAQKVEQEQLNELYYQMEQEGGTGNFSYDAIALLKNFKSKIATAITNAGVETLETDTADTMAENISKIGGTTEIQQVTATADKILKDYTAYKDGKLIIGTMTNNEAVTQSLNAGESYTIAEGYHNGSGIITANSLASQTVATATASDIAEGKTAYVNGLKIVGNGKNMADSYSRIYYGYQYSTSANAGFTVTVNIPEDAEKGILIANMYSYNNSNGFTINITDTTGIASSTQLLDTYTGEQAQSAVTSIWNCTFNPGETIKIYFKNPNYAISNATYMIIY